MIILEQYAQDLEVIRKRILQAGDALKLQDEPAVRLDNGVDAEVLVFDLPPLD